MPSVTGSRLTRSCSMSLAATTTEDPAATVTAGLVMRSPAVDPRALFRLALRTPHWKTTLARGLFTAAEDYGFPSKAPSSKGKKKVRMVARGYDKFFNIGEVDWTEVS